MRLTKWINGRIHKQNDEQEFDLWEIDVIKKLAAYEDAEEQGLLVRLPCKVGDTVFLQVDVITLHDACNGLWVEGTFNHFGLVYFSGEIGRNVFLTREEAKAALKGEREDV